jgi:hypothetical protein
MLLASSHKCFFSQISVAQRACEILGDLAAACAVLPRDASFYLMQSLEHVFSIELPANHSHLKPSSAHSTASSRFTSITCNATTGGFCLMVLRVLCPLLSSAAAFPPHISLKLLLAGNHTARPPCIQRIARPPRTDMVCLQLCPRQSSPRYLSTRTSLTSRRLLALCSQQRVKYRPTHGAAAL